MALSSLFFLFLFIGTRAIWVQERPVLETRDGHLLISSAKDRNISLLTFGASTVNINDINLVEVSIAARKAAATVKNWENQLLGSLMREVNQLSSDMGVVQQRLSTSDFGGDGTTNSSATRPGRPSIDNDDFASSASVGQLSLRVRRVERSLRNVRNKLRENGCAGSPCENGGTCIRVFDGFQCICTSNWEGQTCTDDVNECAIFAGTDLGCQNGATCTNLRGSYRCSCQNGWHGIHCNTKLSTCEAQDSAELCGHGTCIPSSGDLKYTCICDQGWESDGSSPACRKDVNECTGKHPSCSKNPLVPCFNYDGGYRCGSCPAGYTGNGHYCHDINECLVDNGGCSTSPRVECINSIGSWSCGDCPAGYQGDGVTCNYVGACRINNGGCSPQATCVETSGYVQCNCRPGFHGSGVGPQGCHSGTDMISPCSSNPCIHGTCHTSGDQFVCRCNPRFTGIICDREVNPCSPNPCQNGGTCRSTDSSTATCNCTAAFTGSRCEVQRQSCNALYKNPSGTFEYPSNGMAYEHGLNCAFVILLTNTSLVLNITITRFDFEKSQNCRFDFLQIHDGQNAGAHQMGRFCGTNLPFGGNFVTTHNAVYFWMRTDSSDARRGFAIRWESIKPVCGGVMTGDNGRIASPGSPGQYPHNRECLWAVFVRPGKRIQFHFYSVMIEEHPTCDYDYLEINETAGNRQVQLGLYCNHTHPDPLLTSGSSAILHFHSDGAGSDMGFQISYSTVEGTPGCGGVFTADHGTITTPGYPSNYPPRMICDWKIQLPKGEKIRLTWVAFDIERQRTCRFDAVQVFSGPDTDSPVVGRYCGDELPTSVVIESNVALIVFTSDWSLQKRGFQLKYETVCGGVFNEPTGILKSPYYPEDYPGSRTCLYEIIQPAGKGIVLSIVDMEIEGPIGRTCYFDGLNIYDGDNDNATLLGSLCGQPGNIPSEPYFSTHNYMFLKFFTDGSAHNRGFLANYTTVDRRCGGLLKEPSGLIRSHVVGETYGENEDCTWTLKAPKGYIVQLGFTTFSLEGGIRCIADYVSVYDTSKGQEMGRFCGSNLPPTLTTQGESMTVTFHSDFSVSHEGFIAHYVFVDATKICGAHYFTTTGVIISPNYPKSYPPNKECVWVITAPQKQQVILEVNQFDLEGLSTCHFDSLEIRNGGTEFSPLIGKYCGTNIPRRIKSLTHEIYLKFRSDSSRQMGGFNISWDTSTFGCGGVLNGSKGEIMSPGYPQPYIRLANCLWTIAVSEGSKVQLVMVDFDLEGHQRCRYDYMEISTGADENRRNGDRYCGTDHPSVITLDSNLVTIRFRSDYSNSGRGFHIRYETLCYNKVRGFNGVIESPNFPNHYPNSANCTWTIEAPKGNKINLTFSHFELESPMRDGNCSFDYLQISEGENDVPNTELGTYCDTDLPPRVSSTVNQVFVHFSTDAYFTHGGFRFEWMVVGCGGYLRRPYGEITSPGYPDVYPENVDCEWLIELDHGHSVEISFVDVNTEKYMGCKFDKIQLFSGIDANAPKLAEFCHSEGPINYTSPTNKLFIKFESDFSYAGRGFKAEYKSVVLECGGNFHAPQGVIHSTNYPNNYPANQNCEWLISVDRHHLVNLTFSDFDIEDTTNCTDDYVKVFDGASRDDLLLGTFCRNDLPPSIISSGDKLLVAMRSDSLVGAKGFKALFSKACGARIVTEGTGTLESTSLLHMQNEEINCTWTVVAKDPANHVTLNIFYMELETAYDIDSECRDHFIQVYEGDGIDGPSLGRWCANKAPPSIISNGYALTVHLYAPYGVVDDKFGFTYSVLDSTCGGEYISASGAFSSPNYPENYIVNATCIWMLNTSPGNRISLTFTEFELEQSLNCDRDYLEIRENSGIGKLIGIYCTGIPEPIISPTKLWIKFRSDDVGSAKGFRADYTFLHGNELTGMNGEIATPLYPRDWKLKDDINWRITVTFGMAIRLEFDVVRIERMYDECLSRVTVYDGYDENAPVVATICGMMPPKDPIISSSNVMYIQFTSEWVRDSNLFHLNWYQVPRETTIDNGQTRLSECEVEYDLTSIDNNTVTFWSPGFPEGYADNLDCTWVITTTPGSHLNMRFIQVDLEETRNCVNDYASVYNGHGLAETLDDTQRIAKVCRSNDTGTRYTAKTVMTVKFHSDYYINGTGIKAFVWRECGGDLSGPNGVIDFNITKRMYDRRMMIFRCEWNITVGQGRTIEVKFSNFKIENTDATGCKDNYILLKNGAGPESPLLGAGKFCGKRAPSQQLITTGNKLYVKAVGPWAQIDFKMTYKEVLKDCGGFFRVGETDDQMQFSSPNYPNIPPPFTECFWKFMAPAGGRLSLHFIERFDLTNSRNCTREYVEVRDGGTEYSILLGRFCRDTPPSTLTTTGNMLYVHFYTDVDDPKNGFKAAVTTGEVCGGILRGQTGVIRSPNYPATYPINQACGWWIDGPPDHTLKLEFRDLHLPSLRRCKSSDYVSIGERLPFNDTVHTFGDFCGSRKPDIMETSSNEAIISFHSDNRTAVNFRGFVLNYTASRETCGGVLSGVSGEFKSSGYPNPNVRSRYCLWSIVVPEGAQAVLDILDLDIKDTDNDKNYGLYLMIANDENSRSVITVIRQAPYQKKIRSTSRYMTIGFYYTPGHRGLRARYSAASPAPCGGPTDEAVGILHPPVAPYNDSTFYCQWNLRAPDTMVDSRNITRTTLTVWVSGEFDVYLQRNELCDYRSKFVRMRDGHHRLGSLCGNFTDKTIMWRSPAPFNTIEILNGTSGGLMSFNVKYEWKACGGILPGPTHTIRSPDSVAYPKSCVWHAKFEDPGAVLRLMFTRMNLGKGSCDRGYIIVRNGGPLSPQIGKYCGNMKPVNITSSTNQLWIEYWASEAPADFEIQLYTLSGSCGGTIRGGNKEISSPGFPTSYPNNAECVWEITGEQGHSIGLVFVNRFNLETSNGCTNDFIQLFDWTYDDKGIGIWKEHDKMCGRNTPQVFNATTNRLKVLFRSNNAVQGDGFRALWEENCGGVFEATKQPQLIESPNYPDAYPNRKSCNYTINRPAGKKIWIEFLDFQLERTGRAGDCKFDNVTIMYHRYSDRENVYCGDNVPQTLSSDKKVTVIFKSDPYVPKRGFLFRYFINECGGDITEPTEIGPPIMKTGEYFGSLNCTWVIKAPEGKSVVLRFNQFHLETSHNCMFDQVIVTEGDTLEGQRLAKLCGNVSEPFPVRTVGNKMTVMFRSDSSSHFAGMRASVIFTNSIANGCGGTLEPVTTMPFRTQKAALYENFEDCQWTIKVAAGKFVRLTINTMDLKSKVNSSHSGCNGDFLEVRDGAGPFSSLIGRYCGSSPSTPQIPPIDSSLNALWIRFYTDGSTVGEGVTATLSAVDSPCGKNMWDITNQTEVMKSPGYPGDYPAGIHCRWIFKIHNAPYGQIRVHFEEMDMENSKDCTGDHFEISDEPGKYISEDFGEDLIYNGINQQRRRGRFGIVGTHSYCGKMNQFDYHSGSNEVHIILKTTAQNLPKPRKFKFEVEKATCSRNYTAEQGRIIHQDFEECWTTITAKPNETISVYFNNFRMYDYHNCSETFLKVYQGDFTAPNPKIVCSIMDPNPIFSTGNMLSFHSKTTLRNSYVSENYDMLYTTTDKGRGCGGRLFNTAGTFTSPMYPMNYRNDSMCGWEISVPSGSQVALEFVLFDMGASDICSTDYMEIKEENTDTPRTERYCPGQTPATFRAQTNVVTVTSVTSVNNGGTGWVIRFRAIHSTDVLGRSKTYWRGRGRPLVW